MADSEKQLNERNNKIINRFREGHYMTIKQLKSAIQDLPDDGLVLYQRIEDVYFDNHHWDESSILKPDPLYPEAFDQYVITWGSTKYDNENLYITAHY